MTGFSSDDLHQHADAMRRLARDLLRDSALADDAVQQAYATAIERPPALASGIAGWLLSIVRSCAIDLQRSEARRKRREHAVADDGDAASVTPTQTAERFELQEAIASAVRGLGEPYTTTVWLRYYEDLSPTQIAVRLGEPVKTIKTRLWRALQQLRTRLDDRDGGRTAWLLAIAPLAQVPLATNLGAASAAGVLFMQGKMFAAAGAVILVAAGAFLWRPAPAIETADLAAANVTPAAVAGTPMPSAMVEAPKVAVPDRVAVVASKASDVGPHMKIRVLANDQPLSDVQVYYEEPGNDRAAMKALSRQEQRRLNHDGEALLQRVGKAVVTDSDGIAQWPWFPHDENGWWRCIAHSGDLYGETSISSAVLPGACHELHLLPDREFSVQVVDAHGQPASDIAIRATYLLRDQVDEASEHTLGFTDAQGLLLARHVQTWSDGIAANGSALPFELAPRLLGMDLQQQVDAAALPSTPVVFTLPPTGSFEVTVRDAFGEPVEGQQFDLYENESYEAVSDSAPVDSATTDERGTARFLYVPLGKVWRLGRALRIPNAAKRHIGPREQDEVVRILLQPDPAPVVTAKVLRDGKPVVDSDVWVSAWGSSGLQHGGAVTSADDGLIRLALTRTWLDQSLTKLTVRPYTADREFDGTLAVWLGDAVMTARGRDLGTLELRPEPILVAVQFVLPEAELPDQLGFVVQAATGNGDDVWQSVPGLKRREPEGRFTVFGNAPNAPLRLSVTTFGQCLPVEPVPFAAGARDVRIELRRGGSVRASVQVADKMEAFSLQPLLVPTDLPQTLPSYGRFDAGLDPRVPVTRSIVGYDPIEFAYTWPAVKPGHYRLEVHARCINRPLLVVPSVVVVDGERNADEQLQHLTIPRLRAIELALPQADAVTVSTGVMRRGLVAILDGDQPGEQCWRVDSPMVYFAATHPIDVLVRLNGFADRIVRGITDKQVIELKPGLPVTLTSEGPAVVEGQKLQFELECLDDPIAAHNPAIYSPAAGGSLPSYQRLLVAAEAVQGVAKFRLPRPGRYRITAWQLGADGARGELLVQPGEVAIDDGGGAFALRLARR